jgi:class 3 adenylate cyclase
MFTDVRSFTKLSEGMPSNVLTDFLGALNEVLGKPLFDYEDQGIVAYTDKFIGDGTMNIFTDAEVSLQAAVKIRQQLRKFNADPQSFFKEAQEGFRVNIGTGLAYGPVTLGIMGHSRRIDYTPIGDTVNLASRLESLTKIYHTPILINDALYQRIRSPFFYLRHIDRIRVKGKEQPVDIYEEFGSNSPQARDMKMGLLPRFKELQGLYFSGKDWNSAIALAKELSGEYYKLVERYGLGPDSPVDYLPDIYIKRMRTMLANPELAANWDGVYTFTAK